MKNVLLFFSLFVVAEVALASPAEIKVLVVYTDAANDELENNPDYTNESPPIDRNEHATQNIDGVNDILRNSELDDDAVLVGVGTRVIDIDEDAPPFNSDAREISERVNDNPQNYNIGNKSLEQVMNETEADIVIVVAQDITQEGAADMPGSVSGDPDVFTGVARTDELDGSIWAHEIGHIGGVDHHCCDKDDNENPIPPMVAGGRGYKGELPGFPPEEYGTVMSSPATKHPDPCSSVTGQCKRLRVYSDKDRTTYEEDGKSYPITGDGLGDATNVLEQTLPAIGGYAEGRVDEPTSPNKSAEVASCAGTVATYAVTFWEGANSDPVSHFELERFYGTWTPDYDGASSCVPHTSSGDILFRVRAWNAAGSSSWVFFSANNNCSGGGEMGGL